MIKKILRRFNFIVKSYHFFYAFWGALIYRFPSSKIRVVAVTGTNGKTTTVNILARVLQEAGYKVAVSSSARFEINGKEEPNLYKMTMPGKAVIQKLLRRAVNENCDIAIIEVTSEGIKQYRHKFINFDVACFTNLSPEHIESHGGFENYKKEKGKLFDAVKNIHIVNTDDENADYFLQFESKKKIFYGTKNNSLKTKDDEVFYFAENIIATDKNVKFVVNNEEYFLNIPGKFNVYNALVAIAFAREEGVAIEKIKKALKETEGVPGRMEEVISSPFRVLVDYAVTPITLEGTYKEILESFSPSHLISVFGSCGGGRDKWKRPVLGEIAKKYCDRIIVTNEDPYDENEEEIIDSILSGTEGKGEKIIDRREAIRSAMEKAEEGDVIVITGKGNEPWLCVANGKKIPWDDRKIVREEFEKIKNNR